MSILKTYDKTVFEFDQISVEYDNVVKSLTVQFLYHDELVITLHAPCDDQKLIIKGLEGRIITNVSCA